MSDLVFKPIIPTAIMSIIIVIMIIIVIINRKNIINRILIIILVFIVSQRPMLKNKEDISYELNFDVIMVVDTTVSMNAEDVNGKTRMEFAKETCKKIMNTFSGSNFALITYDNSAQVKYPFTDNYAAVIDAVDNLKIIDPQYATGSSLSLPIKYLRMALESAQKNGEYHNEKRYSVVFFIGDGELSDTERANTNFNNYSEIKKLINYGAVLGVGTKEGGTIKVTDDVTSAVYQIADKSGYILDIDTGKRMISQLNEDNLKELAEAIGVDYFKAESGRLNKEMEEIKEASKSSEAGKQKKDKDVYYYFSIPLIILSLIELFYIRRNEL